MNTKTLKATGLALAMVLAPAVTQAVEVLKTDDVSIDLGARMQLLGTFQNLTSREAATWQGARDETQIYLFEQENRLKLSANLDGVKFILENAMGNDAFLNNSNNYSYGLYELNASIPLGESTSVVAGLFRRPESVRDAYFSENLLFAGESQLANLFFNDGSDLGLYLNSQFGSMDALVGVVQGTPNLPQRYIPERLSQPVPLIARVGIGNINEDPSHLKQQGFEKPEDLKWRVGAGAFWAADSNAGHGNLFGNFAGQAENTKGPFQQGNMLFSKTYYNPFMAAGMSQNGGLAQLDNQFYSVNVNSQFRAPMGEGTLVAGAEWEFEQYISKGDYKSNAGKGASIQKMGADGVLGPVEYYHYAQITVQGGELYLGYVADKWWAATRLDVLVPDELLGARASDGTFTSAFGNMTQYEITFPALGYRINKFVTLTAELEHNLNSTLAVDTDGVYNLKTVPIESTKGLTVTNTTTGATTANNTGLVYNAYQLSGRLQLQVAF